MPTIEAIEAIWQPMPGTPQERAYHCDADVIGFGGSAGSGKSDLLLGTAMTKHRRAVIFRSYFNTLSDLIERGNEIQDGRCSFVSGDSRAWKTTDLRRIRLAAIDDMRDFRKHRGRPNDFLGIDEAAEFDEDIVRALMGWVRTTIPTQKTQTIMAFNPPTTPEGEWVVKFFAPWLDQDYPNPAAPGEIRFFARINDEDVEVPDETLIEIGRGLPPVRPQSRTFIPGKVTDNKYLMATDYPSQLNALREPLRSQVLFGDFSIKPKDDPWQVIPGEWIELAMKRGESTKRPDLMLRGLGVDASRGGDDQSVIASMWGNWIGKLDTYPGKDVPDGPALAKLVEDHLIGQAVAFIDVIGIGTSPYDILRMRKRRVYGVNFAAGSDKTDKSRLLTFSNRRAEAYWRAMEMLDPSSDWEICLPRDRELAADLKAPRYSAAGRSIRIEEKDEIKKRIHRSPDKGDAVVMLLWGVYNNIGGDMKFA